VTDLAVPGVRVGHWTGERTGVTVVLLPEGAIGSCEVRGGAPASRETALLDPARTVERIDAVVVTGGSAFGLATADGVMRYLAERGRGFPTAAGVVPIVPAVAVFDLLGGDARPGPDDGYAAARAADADDAPLARGAVGAGRGATIGKWRGRAHAVAGGFGTASASADGAHVMAFAVVNAVGDVVDAAGRTVAGSTAAPDVPPFPVDQPFEEGGNTTLVVVVTDARADKLRCHLLAQHAQDGIVRAVRPAHTRFDGDIAFAVSTGAVEAHFDRVREAAADCAAAAIRDAVGGG